MREAPSAEKCRWLTGSWFSLNTLPTRIERITLSTSFISTTLVGFATTFCSSLFAVVAAVLAPRHANTANRGKAETTTTTTRRRHNELQTAARTCPDRRITRWRSPQKKGGGGGGGGWVPWVDRWAGSGGGRRSQPRQSSPVLSSVAFALAVVLPAVPVLSSVAFALAVV